MQLVTLDLDIILDLGLFIWMKLAALDQRIASMIAEEATMDRLVQTVDLTLRMLLCFAQHVRSCIIGILL